MASSQQCGRLEKLGFERQNLPTDCNRLHLTSVATMPVLCSVLLRCQSSRFWIVWTAKSWSPYSCQQHGSKPSGLQHNTQYKVCPPQKRIYIYIIYIEVKQEATDVKVIDSCCTRKSACKPSSSDSSTAKCSDMTHPAATETSQTHSDAPFLVHVLPTRNVESNHVRAFFDLHCEARSDFIPLQRG